MRASLDPFPLRLFPLFDPQAPICHKQPSGQRNPTKIARQSFAVGHELSARNLEERLEQL